MFIQMHPGVDRDLRWDLESSPPVMTVLVRFARDAEFAAIALHDLRVGVVNPQPDVTAWVCDVAGIILAHALTTDLQRALVVVDVSEIDKAEAAIGGCVCAYWFNCWFAHCLFLLVILR